MSSIKLFSNCFGKDSAADRGVLDANSSAVQAALTAAVPNYNFRECINCTKCAFKGTETCKNCDRPLREEVVSPQTFEAAKKYFEATTAPITNKKGNNSDTDGNGVLLAFSDRCLTHRDEKTLGSYLGRCHPERPERAAAIMAQLQTAGIIKRCLRTRGREATQEELLAVHDKALIAAVEKATTVVELAAKRSACSWYGPEDAILEQLTAVENAHIRDCYFNAATAACARLAAGSAADVARRVVSGAARHGAAIIRPPGHHAESSVAMGFCYYNNAAVAARAAQAAGARRVVIVDWDVHHGNGTQDIFLQDASVLYISTHRYDHGCFYPGSGDAKEVGSGAGMGFTVNVPWNHPGVCDADMLAAFRHVIVPLAREFRPDLVIVSAGFDAVQGDPLGGCQVSPAAYGHFTEMLSALAPTVLLLEGGYNLTATAAATEACMRVLLGEASAPLTNGVPNIACKAVCDAANDPWVASGLECAADSALQSLLLVLRRQSEYWKEAREHLTLVEAALIERGRRRSLAAQRQTSMQPRDQKSPGEAAVEAAVAERRRRQQLEPLP